jgi:Arc/MetJ family transcription regulator
VVAGHYHRHYAVFLYCSTKRDIIVQKQASYFQERRELKSAILPDWLLAYSYSVYYNVYWRIKMRTNIVLDDTLVEEAFKFSQAISTKKELIEAALKEYVNNRKRKNLKELKGRIKFRTDYDYKKMREMK